MHHFKLWDKQKERFVGQQWIIPDAGRFVVILLSGLTDKKGIDICDKDIVTYRENKYAVEYMRETAIWIMTRLGDNTGYFIELSNAPHLSKDMEVIGNVLQKPKEEESAEV